MGWRNIWRNPRRTFLTILALALPLGFMIVNTGINYGFIATLTSNMTDLTLGEYQVHHHSYLQDRSLYDTIEQYDTVLANVRKENRVAAPRWYGYGLLANDATGKSAGVEIQAVDIELEKQVTTLSQEKNLFAGRHLTTATGGVVTPNGSGQDADEAEEIVLGKKVAQTLRANVGDLLVLVTTGADGSIGNELFRVVGILKNVGDTLDRTRVIIGKSAYLRLFSFNESSAHEIAIGKSNRPDPDFRKRLESVLPKDLQLSRWDALVPLVADLVGWMDVVTRILMGIIYIIASMVMVNAILMMVFERTREFGVMLALGYPPSQVVLLVMFETMILTGFSVIGGLALGGVLNLYMITVGIDLSHLLPNGIDFMGTVIDPVMRSRGEAAVYIRPTLVLVITTLIASLYPAIKAARLLPVEALYKR
jgi:ABC-type lipoprotein release transport system permease subunit